jgi:hypothetical protein
MFADLQHKVTTSQCSLTYNQFSKCGPFIPFSAFKCAIRVRNIHAFSSCLQAWYKNVWHRLDTNGTRLWLCHKAQFMLFVPYIYVICTVHFCYLYRTFMLFVPYIYVICTVHLCYLYRTFMLSVPYIYVICTVHLCYLYRTFMLFVPYIFLII